MHLVFNFCEVEIEKKNYKGEISFKYMHWMKESLWIAGIQVEFCFHHENINRIDAFRYHLILLRFLSGKCNPL